MIVVAVALYLFVGKIFPKDPKKGRTMVAHYAKKSLKIVAIILLVIGVNRTGIGTNYYLTQANPMILQEMAQNMQGKRSETNNREVRRFIRKHGADMAKHAPILGNADAKNTIFVFTDYTCPYCRRAHNELNRVLAERDDVRVVIKNFSIHGVLNDDAARATIAATLQGQDKAAKLVDMLFEKDFWPSDLQGKSQDEVARLVHRSVMDIAQKAGLSVVQLQEDMQGPIVQAELDSVRKAVQELQIGGTPYLIVGEQAFPGAVPFQQIMQALR